MKKVKLGLVKKIISIVGLASIASIPAIALVSCSNDSSSSDSGSSGNSGGNNNSGNGSNQSPSDPSQQKQYLSFTSSLSVERDIYGTGWDNILIDEDIEFKEIKENIRNYKWFDENGNHIKYKIKLNLESGFFVGRSCDDSGIDINEPFGPNNFVKRIGDKNKNGAIDAEIVFWKENNDDNFNSEEDFYIEWFNGEYYEKISHFMLTPSFEQNYVSFGGRYVGTGSSARFIISNNAKIGFNPHGSYPDSLFEKNKNLFLHGKEAYTNSDPYDNKLFFNNKDIPEGFYEDFSLGGPDFKFDKNKDVKNVGTLSIEKINE